MTKPPRLTRTVLAILQYLETASGSATSGAAIQKATRVGTHGLYPLLHQCESVGWLGSTWEILDPPEPIRARRRLYHLTPVGRQALQEALAARHRRSWLRLPWFASAPA